MRERYQNNAKQEAVSVSVVRFVFPEKGVKAALQVPKSCEILGRSSLQSTEMRDLA